MDRICHLEKEIEDLKAKLWAKERELEELKQQQDEHEPPHTNDPPVIGILPKWAIERYSRQILLTDVGPAGQERLCAARVLLVGAGGLGCPAAAYLAGAGVGEIGIVDFDNVELSNIHRQILHTESDQNINKAVSAAESLRKMNSRIKVRAHAMRATAAGVLALLRQYDMVLDCTDNVATRYLLGDACAILKMPLVSGSALRMEGQLSVFSYSAEWNKNEKDASLAGPCYRCVFPTPPPQSVAGSCAEHGVAGPVPGVIGCLQALEAIKLLVGHTGERLLVGRMLIFDGEDMTFRNVKLRARSPGCRACSGAAELQDLLDYETFCSARAGLEDAELDLLPREHRVTARSLAVQLSSGRPHLIVDVRSPEEYRMCRMRGAVSYPMDTLRGEALMELLGLVERSADCVTVVCRRGNDSQLAVKRLLEALSGPHRGKVRDLAGGLHAWAAVDRRFPVY